MASLLFVSCLVLVSLLKAGLFESLEKQAVSNAADCTKLNTEALCNQVGACVWGSSCTLDPCFERTILTSSNCKSNCHRLQRDGKNTSFCITPGREVNFTTVAQFCTLESGDIEYIEMPACRVLDGCGPVVPIAGVGETYYVCQEGAPPKDPCKPLPEDVCPFVGMCMWDGECVQDLCWEKTKTEIDSCRTGCTKHIVNPGGTPVVGYCKTGAHDLVSVCNADTATSMLGKVTLCMIAATDVPSNCSKTVTISKFDGDDYYVCHTEEKEFTVAGAAVSVNSIFVAFGTLLLLALML